MSAHGRRLPRTELIHGGRAWTKGKLTSVPDDRVTVPCNCMSGYMVAGSAQGSLMCPVAWEILLFSFFENTEMNTVYLIDIIGILSGYLEANTRRIPAALD